MKKLLVMLLALALCLGVAAAETADVTGTWYLNEVLMGEDMSIVPAVLNLEMTMTLNADYSAVLEVNGSADEEATWAVVDGSVVVTSQGEPQAFVLEGDCLVAAQDEMKIILGREKIEVGINADAAMEDYTGNWLATLVEMAGMQADATEMGLKINVQDGKAMISEGEGEAAEAVAQVEEGVLYITNEGEEGAMPLRMLVDGRMIMTDDMGNGVMMTIYFEKIK